MKITSISDLHLEMCISTDLPGGDLLLMAGDIFSAFPFLAGKNDADSRKVRKRTEIFCREQLSKYARVLYVKGNHEAYRATFEDVTPILRAALGDFAPNVQLLDDEAVEIDGIVFLGTTLWAKCGVGTAEEYRIANVMRDFSAIRVKAEAGDARADRWGMRAFQPADAAEEHTKALAFLERAIPADKPAVLLTHHAPTFLSGHGVEMGSAYLDDAYCANLFDIFARHPNIKLAVHGHTHIPERYRVEQALVLSNPRGYFPYERRAKFFEPSAADITLEELLDAGCDGTDSQAH